MRVSTGPGLIAAVGLSLVGGVAVHVASGPSASSLHSFVDVVLIGGSGLALLYGAYWHAGRSLLAEQPSRIFAWTVTVELLFVAVGVVALFVGSRRVEPVELIEVTRLTASVGVATGLFVGTTHARAVDSAEAAARAEARTEAFEAERERAERLNDLLRHYVLNGVSVVDGHVDRLRPAVPEGKQSSLDAIDRRVRSMTTLVEHINSLLAAERESPPSTTVDLATAVESVVVGLDCGPSVRLSTPDAPVSVRATGTLDDALQLLFDGVASVTDAGGEMTVVCEDGPTAATVTVTARPVDLSATVADSLFEPIADVGLEFDLARRLLGDYSDLRLVGADADALRVELRIDAVR